MSGGDLTCPHQGKYQVPWVSPPEFLPTLQQASAIREYLFIASQPVPDINRRLEIPPDVIPGGKKGHSPSFSCLFLPGMYHLSQGCVIPPSTVTCLQTNS